MAIEIGRATPAVPPSARTMAERAAAIWPRLDRRLLAACGSDAHRMATYIARRTSLPVETIVAILEPAEHDPAEASNWFG
jgi:hypothetical protein